ncbi:helitron_like_N domain-containing protein [Trichonephila clavipes]|nr:helitron_like_N domain-containing protein [Trichonephila clavipes]
MLKNVNVTEVKVCSTCLKAINKNSVPLLSVYNGFKYPPFPQHLKNFPLDLVTERLISPRIPFMQIRRLRHVLGQFGIYGQVINVPIEVNTMVNSLPRNIDDDHSITVHIKRKKIHKSNYLCGIVNKRKIKAWLQHLKDSPLYTSYGITVDDSFFNGQDDIQDEIIYDEDGDNDISEQIPIDESLVAQQQTLMWNDEMYLTIAPGEGNVPVSLLFDEHAEELSFPQIYLGQFRTFRDGVNVTSFMMATSELRRSDRRGVTPQHLLYMAMKIIRIRIRDSLSIAFKHVGKGTTITKEQIKSEEYVQGCIESNLAFLRTIPNSAFYWLERKKDLFAMIRQYGKPTVFFTISANEIGWSKLLQLLHNLKYNSEITLEDAADLHYIEKSTLINEDAVTCTIYFNKIEFQHRGSPHAHILAWLDNAPEDALGKDYNKAIDLIDSIISVSAAEASDEEYVNVIRAGINRPKVFPKRQPHEKWHNPFNPFIMNIVQSNTDFQFITEEYSCAAYVVEYINKTNRGVSTLQRKIIEVMDEHPEFDIFEITRNISINLLNHTEITSQEAAWYLLREPMSKSSTIIVYIPTVWPIERQRIKKTMKALSELDDDCTDIWKENWFDKYEKRPQELENVSLAQFVSKYYKNNKEEYVIRNEPKVIRYRNYDMATDLNEYKREMVTSHIPFRHEESEILSQMKFIKISDENVDLILQKRKEFESNIDIEKHYKFVENYAAKKMQMMVKT